MVDRDRAQADRAQSSACGETQVTDQIGLQRRLARSQLAPGHVTVAIGINADRELDIPDRQLHRAGQLPAMNINLHKAIARDMRLRAGGKQRATCDQHPGEPHRAPSA